MGNAGPRDRFGLNEGTPRVAVAGDEGRVNVNGECVECEAVDMLHLFGPLALYAVLGGWLRAGLLGVWDLHVRWTKPEWAENVKVA